MTLIQRKSSQLFTGSAFAKVAMLCAALSFLNACQSELIDTAANTTREVASTGSSGGSGVGASTVPSSPGVPSAPNTLSLQSLQNSVVLYWTPPGKSGPYSYHVYRRLLPGGSYQPLVSNISETQFLDLTVLAGNSYSYKIRATRTNGDYSDTNEETTRIIGGFQIQSVSQAANNDVTLAWTPAAGAETYDIVLGNGFGDFSNVLVANATSPAVISGLTVGSSLTFQVVAKNTVGSGASVRSSSVMRAVLLNPFSFTVAGAPLGIKVDWAAVTGADRYEIRYGTSSGNYTQSVVVNAPNLSTTLYSLNDNTTYYVMMYAYGGANRFPAISELSVLFGQPVSQLIPFDAGTSASYVISNAAAIGIDSGGVCRLSLARYEDNSGAAAGFGGGAGKGVVWDSTLQVLRLGNQGGCDGSLTNCEGALDATWAPRWSQLQHYYRMDGNWQDSKGTNHGSAVNGATFSTNAKVGTQSGSFNGTNSNATFNSPFTAYTNEITVSGWYYSTSTPAIGAGMGQSQQDVESMASNVWLIHPWGNNTYNFYVNNNGGWITTASPVVPNNTWAHIVGVANPSGIYIYVNGQLVGTGPGITSGIRVSPTSVINIGRDPRQINRHFPGLIDEVAIWNAALTANEIRSIYDRQSVRFLGKFTSRVFDAGAAVGWPNLNWATTLPFSKPLPGNSQETTTHYSSSAQTLQNGLIGLWHLDETTGTTFIDHSGQGRHGTFSGTLTTAPGKFGKSFLASAPGHVEIPYTAVANVSGGWTASGWVWLNGASVGYPMIIGDVYGSPTFKVQYCLGYCGTAGISTGFYDGAWRQSPQFTPTYRRWTHLTGVYNATAGTISLYVDGKLHGTTSGVPAIAPPTNLPTRIGRRWDSAEYINGYLDEIAVWNRPLIASEVLQLYRRGGNQLKIQVRSCGSVDAGLTTCTDASNWVGPDGTSATFFSEINNSNAPTTDSGLALASAPTLSLAAFTNPPGTNRYFQYQMVLESEDAGLSCNYGSGPAPCSPELQRIWSGGSNSYDFTGPRIHFQTGMNYSRLTSLTEVLGPGGCPGGVQYTLSLDQATWHYWNGTAWAPSDGTLAKTATLAQTNAGLSTFATQIGYGTVYVRAHLKSDGSQACEIDSITLNGKL